MISYTELDEEWGQVTSAWHAFLNCVLGAASSDASTLAVAVGTLNEVALRGGHTVYKAALAQVFDLIIRRHAPLGEGSEVAWALWGALSWNVTLDGSITQSISAMEDNVVALLALDADGRSLFGSVRVDKQLWQAIVGQNEVLKTENWLLAYEANRQQWLTAPSVLKDPDFSLMEKAKVSFYDPRRNVPQFPAAARPIPGGSLRDYA